MSRTTFLVLILYALLLAGLASLRGDLLDLALPFFVYLLAGLWRAPEKLDLEVRRILSQERAMPDEDVSVTLEVTNRGADIDELLLEDVLPARLALRFGTPRRLLPLKKGASCSWTYTVHGPRGGYSFGPVKAEAADAFGLRRRSPAVELRVKMVRSELLIFTPMISLK